MKRFITYFDFLGFKNFILNNETDYIRQRIGHILRDIEMSLGQGKTKNAQYGVIADLSGSRLNCLNISDTVIFWTNDSSIESFNELLKVSFDFNWRVTCYHFGVKGAMVYDEIDIIFGSQENEKGGTYKVNSIYGKGLVNAHLKAENLNLASCVIDQSVIDKISEFGDPKEILGNYAMLYLTPYKNGLADKPEFLLKFFINETIGQSAFDNRSQGIERAFYGDNKGENERAQVLLKNTIKFLSAMKE
ncbi:MAG: hypothetical protein LLF93_10820 [Bacteroidales bacterium]|nr:hypothetical protein [Bacteroidales bacterium]